MSNRNKALSKLDFLGTILIIVGFQFFILSLFCVCLIPESPNIADALPILACATTLFTIIGVIVKVLVRELRELLNL